MSTNEKHEPPADPSVPDASGAAQPTPRPRRPLGSHGDPLLGSFEPMPMDDGPLPTDADYDAFKIAP